MQTTQELRRSLRRNRIYADYEAAHLLCPEDAPYPNPHEVPMKHRSGTVLTPQEQTLVIPGRLPAMNELLAGGKTHWAVYHKEKRMHTEKVAMLARAARLKPVQHPVVVCCRWVEKDKRRDKDNLRAALKFILDGLAEAGILPTDGWKWIAGFSDSFDVNKKRPHIVVTLREIVSSTTAP